MSIRTTLSISVLALMSVFAMGRAPAGEAAVPAASSSEAAPAQAGDDARQFVENLYGTMSRGGKSCFLSMADAMDPEALLERALTGLSAQPPVEWRAAALARLQSGRDAMAAAMARFVEGSLICVLPAQPGPDGTTQVTVRLYIQNERMIQTSWHRLTLRRDGPAWHILEIEMLDTGDQLSNLALAVLSNPDGDPLPLGSPARALAFPAIMLAVCLLAGIALGSVLRRAMARRSGGGSGAAGVAIGAVAGVVVGLIFLGAGMVRLFGERGAVDELQRHGASMALARGDLETARAILAAQRLPVGGNNTNVDAAIAVWPQNRMAQMFRAEFLASSGKVEEAEEYLTAIALTSSPPPAVHLQLARLQERARNWPQAAASRMKFSELVGGDALCQSEAAHDLALGQDLSRAEELLAMAARSGPPDFRTLLARAQVHAAARKGAAVVADFRELLALKGMPVDPREAVAIIEQTDDFKPVRGDAAVRAFVQELKSGLNTGPVGPLRR